MTSLPQLAARIPQRDRDKFLDGIRAGLTVAAAVKEVKPDGDMRWAFVHPRHGLVATDQEFAQAYGEAMLQGQGVTADKIEDEIMARAFDRDRKDSALFLRLFAQRHIPAYRPSTRIEMTGAGGGPIAIENRKVSLVAVVGHLLEAGVDAGLLAGPAVRNDRPVHALPAAREILPARPVSEAGSVPAGPEP